MIFVNTWMILDADYSCQSRYPIALRPTLSDCHSVAVASDGLSLRPWPLQLPAPLLSLARPERIASTDEGHAVPEKGRTILEGKIVSQVAYLLSLAEALHFVAG